jgi:hypothetical protein
MVLEITVELLTFLVAILVPFGIAVAWLAVLRTRLNSLDCNVKELQKDFKDISIKFDAHLLATKELSRSGEEEV